MPNSCPGRSARPCSAIPVFPLNCRKNWDGNVKAADCRKALCRRFCADLDPVFLLGPGVAIQRPAAASFPGRAGLDTNPRQLHPVRFLYRLFLRAAAGGHDHPPRRLQEDDGDRACHVRHRRLPVRACGAYARLWHFPDRALHHRLWRRIPGNQRQSLYRHSGRSAHGFAAAEFRASLQWRGDGAGTAGRRLCDLHRRGIYAGPACCHAAAGRGSGVPAKPRLLGRPIWFWES